MNEELYGVTVRKEEQVSPGSEQAPSENLIDDDESMRKKIEGSLDKIRPFLNMEGGDVEFVGLDAANGIVKVRLQGACSHCAISSVTLKTGVEKTLMEDIPEVKGVVQVE